MGGHWTESGGGEGIGRNGIVNKGKESLTNTNLWS